MKKITFPETIKKILEIIPESNFFKDISEESFLNLFCRVFLKYSKSQISKAFQHLNYKKNNERNLLVLSVTPLVDSITSKRCKVLAIEHYAKSYLVIELEIILIPNKCLVSKTKNLFFRNQIYECTDNLSVTEFSKSPSFDLEVKSMFYKEIERIKNHEISEICLSKPIIESKTSLNTLSFSIYYTVDDKNGSQ